MQTEINCAKDVIRLVSPQYPQSLRDPPEKPELERDYRNAVVRHAPSFLQRHIDRIRSLSLIPVPSQGEGLEVPDLDFCDDDRSEFLVCFSIRNFHFLLDGHI